MSEAPACINGCTSKDAADNLTPRRAVNGWLCGRCSTNLETWLRDIPVDYALLPMVAMPGSSTTQDGSSRTKQPEAPAPLNLAAAALTDTRSSRTPDELGDDGHAAVPRDPGDELWFEAPDIPRVVPILHTWAETLRCDLDPSRSDDVKQLAPTAANVVVEVNYLLGAFGRLVEADWVDDAMREIRVVWRALCAAQGVATRPKQFGDCLTVTDAVQCPGKVVEDRNTHLPRCPQCRRTYATFTEQISLKIENEKKPAA